MTSDTTVTPVHPGICYLHMYLQIVAVSNHWCFLRLTALIWEWEFWKLNPSKYFKIKSRCINIFRPFIECLPFTPNNLSVYCVLLPDNKCFMSYYYSKDIRQSSDMPEQRQSFLIKLTHFIYTLIHLRQFVEQLNDTIFLFVYRH